MAGREIVIGGTYRHFKGKLYRVMALGYDAQTEERVVIYRRAEDMDDKIWVRPFVEFMSKVDREKYPDASQEYRFLLMPGPEEDGDG
jgi:hypothetical protein